MEYPLICQDCQHTAEPLDWRCSHCGGIVDFAEYPTFVAALIETQDSSLWRYAEWLPVEKRISLGEGMTPLVETEIDGQRFFAKLEYLNPTGSYKDRGTVTMLNHIAAYKVPEVIDDSSGNAGASVAAYASASGIASRIFVPASGSASKKALIKAFGGTLVEVEGAQHLKTEACHEAAQTTTYASHAWSPYFLLGQMTAGFEIWEQMRDSLPDAIVSPFGHGGLFVGMARGLQILKKAGLIERIPALIAVQSEKIDPLVQAYEAQASTITRVTEKGRTVADGIIVDSPVRGAEALRHIRESGGAAFRVNDDDVIAAQSKLTKRGLIAEPTSAVTVAAMPQILAHVGEKARIVCCLTGNGVKNVG